MSLFVGNLSRNVKYEELREVFDAKGHCQIQKKVRTPYIKSLP